MYCIQCEQTIRTSRQTGCLYRQGACGKTAETADLQDLLIAILQGLSGCVLTARHYGIVDPAIDAFVPKVFFATLTNVNFDANRIVNYAKEAINLRQSLLLRCHTIDNQITFTHPFSAIQLADTLPAQCEQAKAFALNYDLDDIGEEIHGLRMLCFYALKGTAAYMKHAFVLGQYDENLYAQFHEIMAWLGTRPSNADMLLDTAINIGKLNFSVMALLEHALTCTFGSPVPTSVNTKPIAGKAILISGHDMRDLSLLLEQTKDSGIHVYTHGELLPAHGYPNLHHYPHLAGNYGSGWQNQQSEFARFPGPIIMTSNCLINPNIGDYSDRLWTRSVVGWPGVKHLKTDNFSAVIHQAQTLPGFPYNEIEQCVTVGFGRQSLLNTADTLLDLIAQQKLRHIFLIGGCDGGRNKRSYYTDFALNVPKDCLILTLGCGKYRFNQLEFGMLETLPRLMDIGQCNDAYSAIRLAIALSEKQGCSINELPLTFVLSWFEQKAVAILLTLLSVGVKNIYIGPTPPGYLTHSLLETLKERFGLSLITTVEQDMRNILSA